jgi:CRISPR-associated protein Cas1
MIPETAVDPQPDFLPVRMLNEYAYCPRLGYLMWVQNEFADNEYTEDGRWRHGRVDEKDGGLDEPADENAPKIDRSVMLSAPSAELIAKIDVVESEGRRAVPIDYKRGSKPDRPEGAYEPERVQVCAQGLILRENGFNSDYGYLWFVESRERVLVDFTPDLVQRTLALAREFRAVAGSGQIPPPLEDSPKCNGCSLVGVCLPDETAALASPGAADGAEPRRLIPARDDASPVYVQSHSAYVSKSGDALVVKDRGTKVAESKLFETSQLNLFGNAQVTTQAVRELCQRGIPIAYFSTGGWFYGLTLGAMHKNIELRLHQYRAAADPAASLAIAKRIVAAKIWNCRTLLRRNADGLDRSVLERLRDAARSAYEAESMEALLGIEGSAARAYFQSFPKMIKAPGVGEGFSFTGRNRRPPKDPVNAMLSLAYALLTKEMTLVLQTAGFEPFLGFYHQPRYGRPSLALDLIEEFRPLAADSTVIGAINNGVVAERDFVKHGLGVALKPNARKAFIAAFERRMDQLVRHPVFGYRISYRRVLDVQARLLGRYLAGEIEVFPEFRTR